MFAVSIYTMFMGSYYDQIVKAANGDNALAGVKVLQATLVIPVVLIVAFVGLVFYMRGRKKTVKISEVAV
jgi:hypothetical protein